MRSILAGCGLPLVCLAGGCAAMVREQHFFATYADEASGGRLVNIFMLDVAADSQFSNMRYLAGTYDEAAVDYFLNESKASDYVDSDGKSFGRLWNWSCPDKTEGDACKTSWGEARKLTSADPSATPARKDAFVIIMSTNANAIAETIGAIAENSQTMKSLAYLLNKDAFDAQAKLDATSPLSDAHNKAFLAALEAQMSDYGTDAATNTARNANRELAVLKMLAAELDPTGPAAFNTLPEAKAWFAATK